MERMSWSDIKKEYPHQYVGLKDVIYKNNDGVNILSAIVCCTETDVDEEEMVRLAIDKKIIRRYTTLEDIPEMGMLS